MNEKSNMAGKSAGNKADPFEVNWQVRKETYYSHWTRSDPSNQIQLAFRNHWSLLNELMRNPHFSRRKRVLEVGCGRGSLSCYFSDAGYDCTLLDISQSAIDASRQMFEANNLEAAFEVGDVNALPFGDESFQVVFSIGLLEHFEDVELPIREQIRVLGKGGLFFGYVVPKYTDNIQKEYAWIVDILKGYAPFLDDPSGEKQPVYRSDADSGCYLPILKECGLRNIEASGVYPLPMISHSTEFPFSLMPDGSERTLVRRFEAILRERACRTGKHPWLCEEGYGQAFAVWGYK